MKNIKKLLKFKVCFIIILSMVIFPFAMTGCSCSCLILPPFPYNWSEWTVTTDPTCDTYGEQTRVCQNDPSRIETREIPPLANHNFGRRLVPSQRVLIIEREDYSSDKLADMLRGEFYVGIVNIANAPTLNYLLTYGQVILNNVSNADMPYGFDGLLHHFVRHYGRGLLTTGGFRYCESTGDRVPNLYCIYNLGYDIQSSLLGRMLPVESLGRDFVPPIALTIVSDWRGRTSALAEGARRSYRALMTSAILQAINSLNTWDYVSSVSFSRSARINIGMTPASCPSVFGVFSQYTPGVGSGGAAEALRMALDLQRSMYDRAYDRHILFVIRGELHDAGEIQDLYRWLDAIREEGITLTIVTMPFGEDEPVLYSLRRVAERMGDLGTYHFVSVSDLAGVVMQDIANLAIEYYEFAPFRPRTPVDNNSFMDVPPYLNGFFAVRARTEYREQRGLASLLTGPYGVPIYTQWNYGQGRVGSFMSTLNGDEWSYEFMSDEIGRAIILDMIRGLVPQGEIGLVRICACGFIEFQNNS